MSSNVNHVRNIIVSTVWCHFTLAKVVPSSKAKAKLWKMTRSFSSLSRAVSLNSVLNAKSGCRKPMDAITCGVSAGCISVINVAASTNNVAATK